MRLRRDSLQIHSRAMNCASVSPSRLPAIQRRFVFVFRHRVGGRLQSLARVTALSCLPRCDGWRDPSGLLLTMRLADRDQARLGPHLVAIRTASLGDASRCGPQLEVWTSDAQPSDRLNLALPNFETYASATDPATAPEMEPTRLETAADRPEPWPLLSDGERAGRVRRVVRSPVRSRLPSFR